METLKELLAKYGRPFVAKYLTRVLLYGAAALSAKAGIDSPSTDTVTKVAEWGAAVACVGVAALIDHYHHKKDLAEVPPKK